ncbi:UDP-N-acetylmuramoyl-tripeptide--D-alanyl-D-alanine ligase [Loigolactobacillus iwatensis]|uniref:UDP-N-acetylmuramoyl-tripeptide--D-alanyl-D- alanine ligase n=1 Tax=Loigolactobacillus iwatensis TaxID=1267156 RepID=UPI000F7DDA2B|nr:UDP-N-acetylmuramoyl-tripeptide--D-alanyl-D-alanine ligase [Loigolactobacillus iwatensis]
MKMQLAEIANAVQAKNDISQWAGTEISSVAFDSRKLTAGALFIPLVGANDGHDYLANAREHGAVATFWQSGHLGEPTDFPVLEVADPLKALQKLAQYYLVKVNPRVIAVTGSDGKTTTKDMIAAILSQRFNVHKTQGNYNNEIGVPTTILSMETNTEILVLEMGMDRPGQLDFLSRLVEPDITVITMIGEAHIEFFGTRDKIADAKMEITNGLKEDGYFIYNGDEPLLRQRAKSVSQNQLTFGNKKSDDLCAMTIETTKDQTSFTLATYPEMTFTIPLLGAYNVNNAMAAISVGQILRIKPEEMRVALAHFSLTKNRTQWLTGARGESILSDIYNSNPTAMKAVLTAFQEVPVTGRRIAVLGDMLELGDQSATLHRSVATAIRPDKLTGIYLYGDEIKPLADELKRNPTYQEHVHYFKKTEKQLMISELVAQVHPDDAVLLKASNGMHLDEVLKQLQLV